MRVNVLACVLFSIWAARGWASSVNITPSLRGDAGVLRVSGPASPRGSFMAVGAGRYFQARDLLNYSQDGTSSSGTGGSAALSYSALDALEVFLSASDTEYAVSPGGSAYARGDVLIGTKAGFFLPFHSQIHSWIGADVFSKFFASIRGEGFEPDATSIGGRAIWNMDVSEIGVPLRTYVNVGFFRDNSSVFAGRVTNPLYRYALDVAGGDQVIGGVAAEALLLGSRVIPFVEYTTEQTLGHRYALNPQRITPGVRFLLGKGIGLMAGCDLSLKAREVLPDGRTIYLEPPWNIVLALSYSRTPEREPPMRGPEGRAGVEAPPPTPVEKAEILPSPLPSGERESVLIPPPALPEKKKAMVTLEKGRIEIPGETIFFEYDSASVRTKALSVLDSVSEILTVHPDIRVRIEGHSDNVGGEKYNRLLSQIRANNVKTYLITKGVSPDRLEAEGYGSSRPIVDNSTPEGRARNRRVEFIVLK